MSESPTVFVVDDEASVRDSLRRLVESVGLNCETFKSAEDYLAHPNRTRPGCLVLDIRMRGLSGLDLQRQLLQEEYTLPIIFLTAHGDIRTSVRAMKAGAVEFLTKPFHEQELLDAIQHSIEIDRTDRSRHEAKLDRRRRFESLTARERQVLALVVSGALNKQIAADLQLAESTVKLHRSEVMKKMGAQSVAELVAVAGELDTRAHQSNT